MGPHVATDAATAEQTLGKSCGKSCCLIFSLEHASSPEWSRKAESSWDSPESFGSVRKIGPKKRIETVRNGAGMVAQAVRCGQLILRDPCPAPVR
jgi:hypothetical protein